MPKDPSPLLGYNNNIRHKNRVFHVQTEDSGIRHPHIITHLFMDGGRILKSIKTSYAEYLGAEKMADTVRQMMKEQHKGMLIALRDGQFDQLLEEAQAAKAGQPPPAAPKASPTGPKPSDVKPGEAADKAARQALVPPPMPEAALRAATGGPPSDRTLQASLDEQVPATTRMPSQDEEVDVDALERAAADVGSGRFEPHSDLPPPPQNLFRSKEPGTGGGYRTLTPPPEGPMAMKPSRPPPASARRPPTPSHAPRARTPIPARPDPRAEKEASRPAPPLGRPGAPTTTGGGSPAPDGRYAPARPAGIFGQARPKRSTSIFGEDLISDKSLDEVILSYLAEDLEGPTDKKKK